MNVTTITIHPDEAAAKLREYDALPDNRRTAGDATLLSAYRAAAEGQRLINVHAAFAQTGLNDVGEPRLAMARADWSICHLHPHHGIGNSYEPGGALFTATDWIRPQLRVNCVAVPAFTFPRDALRTARRWAPVPHIPPRLRPRTSRLPFFHVLFEVEAWQQYPVDPFLLQHIAGPFYVVVGEWELTALEASLLSSIAA